MDVDWTPHLMLHFDFNSENYQTEDGLERILDSLLRKYEAEYGRVKEDVIPSQRFRKANRGLHFEIVKVK